MSAPAGLLFLDVSSLQGAIDFKAVAAWRAPDGRRIVGVVARAVNGTTRDARFLEYRKAAKASSLKFGAYGVLYPSADVNAQAHAFLDTIGRVEDDELPPSLDWEVRGAAREHEAAARWVEIVEGATGRTVTVYTGVGFTTSIAWPPDSPLAARPLWVAHYTTAAHPLVPSQWHGRFAEWQYSGNGGEHVAGVGTDVDRDVFAEDVDGNGRLDEADVDAFIRRSFIRGAAEVAPAAESVTAPVQLAAQEAA